MLDFDGDVTSELVGETNFMRSLGGTTRFRIAPGRLKGTSILEATLLRFDEVGRSGPLGRLLSPRGGVAPRMKRFYRDDFELLSANLALEGGVAHTENLRLKAEGYEFTMTGRIDLVDLGLDARGEILLGQDLMQAMVASVGLKALPVQPIVIPIPRLRGTATDPKPEPDFRFLLKALTGNLPGAVETSYNIAFVTGNVPTPEGGGTYSGGFENLPRFHENWSGKKAKIRGSFINNSNALIPIYPSPICSCRSTREPNSFFESFK